MATSHCNPAKTDQPGAHCPECDGHLIVDGDETLCADCGLLVAVDRLDRGPEWTPFDPADSIRVGAPLTPTRHDRGLSTEIGFGRNGHGQRLPPAKRRQLNRLRREHSRARWRSKAERNLAHGLGDIARLAAALDLPKSVKDRAATVFREGHGARLAQGRSIEGLAAASVYAACRYHGVLRTVREVASASTASEADVRNDYGVLNVELRLAAPPYPPLLWLQRLAGEFAVTASIRERAVALLCQGDAAGLSNGRRPAGLAAASLYIAAGGRLSQLDIAERAGVGAPTLRSRVGELEALDGEAVDAFA